MQKKAAEKKKKKKKKAAEDYCNGLKHISKKDRAKCVREYIAHEDAKAFEDDNIYATKSEMQRLQAEQRKVAEAEEATKKSPEGKGTHRGKG